MSVESAAPAASLISGAFAELRHNRAWERGMSVRLVRKRAEQYVIGTMRVPQDGAAAHPEFSGKLPGGTGAGMEGVVPNTTIHDGADGAAVASGEVSSVVAAGGAARSQAFDVIFIDPRMRSPPRPATGCWRTWWFRVWRCRIRSSCWNARLAAMTRPRPKAGRSPTAAITARPRSTTSKPPYNR